MCVFQTVTVCYYQTYIPTICSALRARHYVTKITVNKLYQLMAQRIGLWPTDQKVVGPNHGIAKPQQLGPWAKRLTLICSTRL